MSTIPSDFQTRKSKEKEEENNSFFGDTEQNQDVQELPGIKPSRVVVDSSSQQQQPQQRTSQDILKELFSYTPPKPTYDPNREEELRRIKRDSAISKGLNLLTDTIGLKQGANINRKQPDNTEARMLDNIFKYRDDYNRRMDEYNYQNFANKLRTGQIALSQANREEDRGLQERKFQADQAWKAAEFQNEQLWKQIGQQNKEIDQELDKNKANVDAQYKQWTAEERQRHNLQMEIAAMIRAEKTGSSSSKEKFTIYDNDGKSLELSANEREKLLTLILTDPDIEVTNEDIDLLRPKLGESVSTNSINLLVQKYWQRSPSTMEYLNKRYGQEENTDNTEQTTEPEYSTGGYY